MAVMVLAGNSVAVRSYEDIPLLSDEPMPGN
jgi:hypothetical protein